MYHDHVYTFNIGDLVQLTNGRIDRVTKITPKTSLDYTSYESEEAFPSEGCKPKRTKFYGRVKDSGEYDAHPYIQGLAIQKLDDVTKRMLRGIVELKYHIEFEKVYLNSTHIKNQMNIIKTQNRIEELNKSLERMRLSYPGITDRHITEFIENFGERVKVRIRRIYGLGTLRM